MTRTKEQINEIIHEWMGLCWHEFDRTSELGFLFCLKCKTVIYPHWRSSVNYCSDDSPRKLLNGVLEKIWNHEKVELGILFVAKVFELGDENHSFFRILLGLNAHQIASAIAEVLESETM
jgi:hypothetical protein